MSLIRSGFICWRALFVLAAATTCLLGQEPAADVSRAPKKDDGDTVSAAAIAGSKQDPAAVERGGKVFATYCAGCHGPAAKGGPGAPDLVRSLLVLDDEKGLLIAPVIREGRPDKGMPRLNVTEPQITDIVAWLHVRTYSAGHRTTYVFKNVVTGDARKGESYFNGAGKCNTCHSPAKDLAGIGGKYEPFSLQSRWLHPTGKGGKRSVAASPTVTVTLASGEVYSGMLDRIDDFDVSLKDASGEFHSFARDGSIAKVEVHDPLQIHTDLLRQYSDADIHNMTAYLVTLK